MNIRPMYLFIYLLTIYVCNYGSHNNNTNNKSEWTLDRIHLFAAQMKRGLVLLSMLLHLITVAEKWPEVLDLVAVTPHIFFISGWNNDFL